jgi:hypothetical protein
MGITKVPSIWDYVAGGLDRYQEGAQKRRDDLLRNAGLMTQLYGAGAIDSADLTPALQTAGIKATIKPNQAERQRQIVQNPDLNPSTGKPWTEDERKLAGLPSLADVEENKAKYSYLTGGDISDRAAAAMKLPTDLEIEEGKELSKDKRFSVIGPRYVDMAIAEQGGISHKNMNSVIDKAFSTWALHRREAGLPVTSADRSYFSSQALDRLKQQENLEIQRINANKQYGGGGGGMSADAMKQYQRYQTDLKNAQDAQTRLLANPQLGMFLQAAQTNPKYAQNPLVMEYYEAVRAKETAQRNLDMVQYGPVGRLPLAGSPVGSAPSVGRTPGTPMAPPSSRADAMAQAISAGQATIDNARELYSQKKITAAEYLRIKQLLGVYDNPRK